MLRRWNRRVEIQFNYDPEDGRLMATTTHALNYRTELLEAIAPLVRREMKANGRIHLRLRLQSDRQGIDRAGRVWIFVSLSILTVLVGVLLSWAWDRWVQ